MMKFTTLKSLSQVDFDWWEWNHS